jgi:chromosome segregation ATPase
MMKKFLIGGASPSVDVWDVAVAVAGQAPLVAVAVVVLYVLLSREIRNEVRRVERRIERLEERVVRLEGLTSKIEEQLGRVESDVAELKERVGRLEERLGRVESDVAELKERVGRLEERLGRVESDVAELKERVGRLEEQFKGLKEQLGRVEGQMGQLVKAFQIYNSTLLKVLSSKGVLTETEAEALSSHLLYVPPAKSKYFTEEVRQRLIEILKGVKEGRYTAADVKELKRISELIEKEGWENNRRDLLDYNLKLQMLIAILEGRLIARGEWRPEWDLEDW